jgi:sulfate adenylyltransferase subunit 1 (EFTu-like GTPase family)
LAGASHRHAVAGESIGITLTEQIFVERGAVAALESAPPYELTRFKARIFWLGRNSFRKGGSYKLKLGSQEAECQIDSIERVIDASTLETVSRGDKEIFVGRHEVAELYLRTKRPIAFDAHTRLFPPAASSSWINTTSPAAASSSTTLSPPHRRLGTQERKHLLEPRQSHR